MVAKPASGLDLPENTPSVVIEAIKALLPSLAAELSLQFARPGGYYGNIVFDLHCQASKMTHFDVVPRYIVRTPQTKGVPTSSYRQRRA